MLTDKNRIIYLAVLLVAVTSWWLLQKSTPEAPAPVEKVQHTADYFSSGYIKRQMDDAGVLQSEIKAAKMAHYSDDGTVQLEQPVISFFHGNAEPWIIKADKGILKDKGKELLLNGEVYASKAAAPGGRSISIRTSDLRVLPEQRYAETTQWAELSSPPDTTTGIGMQLNYAHPIRIKLLNKVQGKYESR